MQEKFIGEKLYVLLTILMKIKIIYLCTLDLLQN